MCENLVCVATTIGQLQHTEYLKPTFLDTFKWAIIPVFPETVTNADRQWLLRDKYNSYVVIGSIYNIIVYRILVAGPPC